MFGFRRKPPVDHDEFEWLIACTAWGIRVLGGEDAMRQRALIGPSHFPRIDAAGHDFALALFGRVKSLAGMADWTCDLRMGSSERDRKVGAGLALKHETSAPPLGTFFAKDGRVTITYDPTQLTNPAQLVTTFAHELAHYRIRAQPTLPPGGNELEEHATDVVAALSGFGIFMANGARSFAQFQNFEEVGWEMRTAGYLSELAHATELALFVRLTTEDAKAAEKGLKPYLRGPFRKALSALDRETSNAWSLVNGVDFDEWR